MADEVVEYERCLCEDGFVAHALLVDLGVTKHQNVGSLGAVNYQHVGEICGYNRSPCTARHKH